MIVGHGQNDGGRTMGDRLFAGHLGPNAQRTAIIRPNIIRPNMLTTRRRFHWKGGKLRVIEFSHEAFEGVVTVP